ncbi:helix-turn-helix domain-containing protein [Saccharothrix sp. Mg75]|uniref:helix-turn-helix domain-containing protein n=1 Tax=Saccharothrix sp. Mg75 TaxID=3445357 RepID=UPI003EEE6192
MPRRLFGAELRRLRLRAQRSQAEAARAIGRDQGRINKVEAGRSNLRTEELDLLLTFLGVTADERVRMLDLSVEARKRYPRSRAYVDQLPDSYRRFATLEAQASVIMTYERGIFPGLLQTGEYAEAVMRAGDGLWWEPSYEERANRVAFRLERQRLVLDSTPPRRAEFIVTDDALTAGFGGHEVMRRQVEHLLEVAGRPGIGVRLLSARTRDNPASHAGFTLLRFEPPSPAVGFASVAYGPSPYLDDPADTGHLGRVFEWLKRFSFDPAESKDVLREALRRF